MITSPSPRQANPRFSIIDHLISFHILGHSRTALLFGQLQCGFAEKELQSHGNPNYSPQKVEHQKGGLNTSGQKYLMVSHASLNPLGTPQRQNARSAPPDDKRNCQGGGRGIARSHRSLHRSAYRQLVETPFCILQHHELYPASWILEWPSA